MAEFKAGWTKPFIGAGLLVAVAVGLKLYGPEWDNEALVAYAEQLPGSLFVAGFMVLPLVGGPMSLFLIAAGLKFGLITGMLVAAGCIGVHNLVAYPLTHSYLQQPVKRFLLRRGHRIPDVPKRHQAWFTVAFTGVPSIPYTPKLYLLALTNISFRTYFWLGWPTYTISCIVFVGLGDATARLNWNWIIALALVGAGFGALSVYLNKKIRQKLGLKYRP